MARSITLMHTAQSHVDRFDVLANQIDPELKLMHIVRPEWLIQAQKLGVCDALDQEIGATIRAATGQVICTCTTIGPSAQRHGATRVDAPMMHQAANSGAPVLMAYALKSTLAPSHDLLAQSQRAAGHREAIIDLDLTAHWHLFEAGDERGFEQAIDQSVRTHLRDMTSKPIGCVVLAQASMSGAAELLADLAIPVLASPQAVLRAAKDAKTP
jgi:hypothetical protein